MHTSKREPRRASGAEELVRNVAVETGHDAGGGGPYRHGGGQSSKIGARRDASQGKVGLAGEGA